MQQALTASSLEIGLGSGPGMGFRIKGVPAIAVAAMYGAPSNLALLVPADSPLKSAADLKGKRVGVTTPGSLTDWLVRELSRQQGWGSDGIVVAPLGSDAGAARRHGARRARRHRAGGRQRLRARGGRQDAQPAAVRQHREGLLHPRHLRDRRHGRQPARIAAAVPARLVQDRRLHEGQQGFRREDRGEDDRREAKRRRQDLRRADRRASRPTAPGTRWRST